MAPERAISHGIMLKIPKELVHSKRKNKFLIKIKRSKNYYHEAMELLVSGKSAISSIKKIEDISKEIEHSFANSIKFKWELLHAASYYGDIESVDYLIRDKMRPVEIADSSFKSTPLAWAAYGGSLRVAQKLLLIYNANTSVENKYGNKCKDFLPKDCDLNKWRFLDDNNDPIKRINYIKTELINYGLNEASSLIAENYKSSWMPELWRDIKLLLEAHELKEAKKFVDELSPPSDLPISQPYILIDSTNQPTIRFPTHDSYITAIENYSVSQIQIRDMKISVNDWVYLQVGTNPPIYAQIQKIWKPSKFSDYLIDIICHKLNDNTTKNKLQFPIFTHKISDIASFAPAPQYIPETIKKNNPSITENLLLEENFSETIMKVITFDTNLIDASFNFSTCKLKFYESPLMRIIYAPPTEKTVLISLRYNSDAPLRWYANFKRIPDLGSEMSINLTYPFTAIDVFSCNESKETQKMQKIDLLTVLSVIICFDPST